MKQKKKRNNWWIWILVGLIIWFIYSNSLLTAQQSNQESYRVTYFLMRSLQHFGLYADFQTFHHYVRKLAHFTEYAAMGFLVLIAVRYAPFLKSRFWNDMMFVLLVPLSDETLQLFTDGRSGQLTDVLLDICGALFGTFVCYVILLIIEDVIQHRREA